jgi:hypothetical protein
MKSVPMFDRRSRLGLHNSDSAALTIDAFVVALPAFVETQVLPVPRNGIQRMWSR